MSDLKMPERQPADGLVRVERTGEKRDQIVVVAVTDGREQGIVMSEYNAWRIFGMLSLILEIPVPSKTLKAIKLGDNFKSRME